ncbi:hypothetical protein KUTeg_024932 [Tegillarca granosa]|uniref:Uncharacterized protein n=1 Tax=Tegillarca granosa TaxID=220873 RepID=A0ABQ9DYT4_TEGGR|nr:hypothetical protein KUTeg_024927 [Tegillarca granosa]KAJ8298401.1 hypothetical protein KUTeg_024932 [Tegillarca granosa]
MERLLTNHNLMVKSWRLEEKATHSQIRNHLVLMRRAFVQKSVIFCNTENTRKILEQCITLRFILMATVTECVQCAVTANRIVYFIMLEQAAMKK